jgi:hypothetical protein
MKQCASEGIPGIELLVLVMQYIGSLFAPKIASAPLEVQVKTRIAEQQSYTSGFEVQALILYSIAVYWNDETQRARELLDDAIRKALALGMNLKRFANENSRGDPVLAESWRRTWWQLYLTDGHFTSTDRAIIFATSQRNVTASVDLPCDEVDYNLGVGHASPHDMAHIQLTGKFRSCLLQERWKNMIIKNLQWMKTPVFHLLRISSVYSEVLTSSSLVMKGHQKGMLRSCA